VFPGVWPRFGFLFGSPVQMMFDEIQNITNKGRTSSSPVHGGIIDEHQGCSKVMWIDCQPKDPKG